MACRAIGVAAVLANALSSLAVSVPKEVKSSAPLVRRAPRTDGLDASEQLEEVEEFVDPDVNESAAAIEQEALDAEKEGVILSTSIHYRRRRVIRPGQIVALHQSNHRRFLRAHGAKSDTSGVVSSWKHLPDAWTWERWTVVSATRRRGAVAFHNPIHNRYLKMHGARMSMSPPRGDHELPSNWGAEKFTIVEKSGKVALYNPIYKRYVRTRGTWLDSAPWCHAWEQYTVIEHIDVLKPGDIVALHNRVHNRYLNIGGGNQGVSGRRNFGSSLPAGWTWERLTVVDAGNGEIALHSKVFNRFLKIGGHSSPPRNMNSLPKGWAAEKFSIINGPNGNIALHNAYYNKYVRMNNRNKIDTSSKRGPEQLPSGWTWEQFMVKKVGTEPLILLQGNSSDMESTDTDTTTPPIPEEEWHQMELESVASDDEEDVEEGDLAEQEADESETEAAEQ